MNPAVVMFQPMVTLAGAWLAAGRGAITRARALALEAAEEAETSGEHVIAALALHDRTRMGEPEVFRLEQLASLVDGLLVPAFARHAAALAARDGRRLDQVAMDFAAMGANLFAAEAAAEAVAAHRAQGENEAMLASTAMARRHLEACKGLDESVLPSLAALRSGDVGLTATQSVTPEG
jgi:hypothetical protein